MNKNNLFDRLITLEMANNHMGDFQHGIRMIDEFSTIVNKYKDHFRFAWKFQFRDIPTFIHPDYQNRMDVKYVKRFSETNLTKKEFCDLKDYAESKGFISMCTAFDENSLDKLHDMKFQIAKVASCSSTDWPLLDKLITLDIPIIVSTAGTELKDVDNIVNFLQHRGQRDHIHDDIAIMHCVGEYPTDSKNFQLNQIDLFKSRYKDITIGFSTHEPPEDSQTVQLAVAKGVTLFEKHVAVDTNEYPKNEYSATPDNLDHWLSSMLKAYEMCGVENRRHIFSDKEISDLRQFRRGVFAKKKIEIGDTLNQDNVFYAWPNQEDQLLSTDMSKFIKHSSKVALNINEPVFCLSLESKDQRSSLWNIVNDVKEFINKAGVVFPGKADLEISHHHGIENFYNTGLTMITVVNREYCKKLLITLAGQHHPEQYHNKKEETFHVLYGDVQLKLDGKLQVLKQGDVMTISPGIRHEFTSIEGCIIEEISSTHYVDDSYYTDESIHKNKNRKTFVTDFWSKDGIF
jgi:sialic acid synthase SpsE/quercetin dioxygenase-like cupin family protein